ncbi:MAG TPA: hypothetical protein VFK89_09495 [Actinomycetota bacterium]|nr:hypothetical protein [Actinomycetota bacterium]
MAHETVQPENEDIRLDHPAGELESAAAIKAQGERLIAETRSLTSDSKALLERLDSRIS